MSFRFTLLKYTVSHTLTTKVNSLLLKSLRQCFACCQFIVQIIRLWGQFSISLTYYLHRLTTLQTWVWESWKSLIVWISLDFWYRRTSRTRSILTICWTCICKLSSSSTNIWKEMKKRMSVWYWLWKRGWMSTWMWYFSFSD